MSQLPSNIASWLFRNGWTDPRLIDGVWFAFPPTAPMPIAIPYLASGVDPHYCGKLLINLHEGSLQYWLNQGAITCTEWTPSQAFCLRCPDVALVAGLDLLEISGKTVRFRVHPSSLCKLPSDWIVEPTQAKGHVVRTTAHSIAYLQKELAA